MVSLPAAANANLGSDSAANRRYEDEQILACTVDHYRKCVRDEMLDRIVCFGSDPVFIALCRAMAHDLGISLQSAGQLLWPTSHAIYQSAEAANGLRR